MINFFKKLISKKSILTESFVLLFLTLIFSFAILEIRGNLLSNFYLNSNSLKTFYPVSSLDVNPFSFYFYWIYSLKLLLVSSIRLVDYLSTYTNTYSTDQFNYFITTNYTNLLNPVVSENFVYFTIGCSTILTKILWEGLNTKKKNLFFVDYNNVYTSLQQNNLFYITDLMDFIKNSFSLSNNETKLYKGGNKVFESYSDYLDLILKKKNIKENLVPSASDDYVNVISDSYASISNESLNKNNTALLKEKKETCLEYIDILHLEKYNNESDELVNAHLLNKKLSESLDWNVTKLEDINLGSESVSTGLKNLYLNFKTNFSNNNLNVQVNSVNYTAADQKFSTNTIVDFWIDTKFFKNFKDNTVFSEFSNIEILDFLKNLKIWSKPTEEVENPKIITSYPRALLTKNQIDIDSSTYGKNGSWDFICPSTLEFRGIVELYGLVMYILFFIFLILFVLSFFSVLFGNESIQNRVYRDRGLLNRVDSKISLYRPIQFLSNFMYNKKEKKIYGSRWMYNAYLKNLDSNLPQQYWVYFSKLEFIWTLVPCLILLFISIPSFTLALSLDEAHKPASWIKVIGNQWYWIYEYGSYKNQSIIYSNIVVGSDLKNNALRLYETDNLITLKENEHTRLLITSTDVIHSWTIPTMGVKVDACPGRINSVTILPTRSGIYFGQCSELCGVNHAFMPICVEVVK